MSSGTGRFQFSRNRGSSKGSGNSHSNSKVSSSNRDATVEKSPGGRWGKLSDEGDDKNSSSRSRARHGWGGATPSPSTSSAQHQSRAWAQRDKDVPPSTESNRPSALSALQWKNSSTGGNRSHPHPASSNTSKTPNNSSGSGSVAADKRELLSITDGFYNAILENERESAQAGDQKNVDSGDEDSTVDVDQDDDDSSTGSSIGSVYGFGSQSYRSYRHRAETRGSGERGKDGGLGKKVGAVCRALFVRLSTVRIPYKQPNNWGKEVSSAIRAVCKLDRSWLTPQDYASVSRFITRASAEKQLMLSAETTTTLFTFLLGYIESNGRICDKTSSTASLPSTHARLAQQSVMHELLRAFAQLLADCGQHLDAQSQQTLSVLLPFCDPRSIDIDCRFAAIDALGNFFKSLNNTSAGGAGGSSRVSGIQSSTGVGRDERGKISRNTLGGTTQRILAPSDENGQRDGPPSTSSNSSSSSSVDDTLRECLRVVVSNLHACVAQHCSGGGGMLDRMFISVVRTLIALYAYLHTLNLNLKQNQNQSQVLDHPAGSKQAQPEPEPLLLYQQQRIDKSRAQAEAFVPEILSELQLVLHKAYQLLKVDNKFSARNKSGELPKAGHSEDGAVSKLAVSVAAADTGDHDSTVRLLHHSLHLLATLFLFERPDKMKSHWPVFLSTPLPSDSGTEGDQSSRDEGSPADTSSGVSVLSFLDMIHEISPGEFIVARDKYRVISAYAVWCIVDSIRRHCDSLLSVVEEHRDAGGGNSARERSNAVDDFLAYSQIIRKVVRYLLPVAAHEGNPNIFHECVKVLQCGTQHFLSLAQFVARRPSTFIGTSTQEASLPSLLPAEDRALDDAAASCRALANASYQLVFYRSVELHPQKLLRYGTSANEATHTDDATRESSSGDEEELEKVLGCKWNLHAVVPALVSAPGEESAGHSDRGAVGGAGLGSIKLRRTTNSMLCAVESFMHIVSECSRPPSLTLTAGVRAEGGTESASSSSLSPFITQPLHIYGISALADYFHHMHSDPVVSTNDRFMNHNSPATPPSASSETLNWRRHEEGSSKMSQERTDSEMVCQSQQEKEKDAYSVVEVSSYFGLLLDKCELMFQREDPITTAAAPASSSSDSNSAVRDVQEKLKAALHITVLTICQRESSVFCLEMAKVRAMLASGFQSPGHVNRLFCVKVAGELLVHLFHEREVVRGGVMDTEQWVIEIIRSVLVSCNDVDHQIRIGAAACVGTIYKAVFGDAEAAAGALSALRGDTYRSLLQACRDPIGTVRTEGVRVLGEVLAEGVLPLLLQERPTQSGNSIVDGKDHSLGLQIFLELQTMMGDSKLAVRMQAVWALGNIIKDLLPYRLLFLSSSTLSQPLAEKVVGTLLMPRLHGAGSAQPHLLRPGKPEVESWRHMCADELWSHSLQIALSAIETDSEKMMPASVRLLALLCCGIGEEGPGDNGGSGGGGTKTPLSMNDATTCLLTLIFGRADTIPSTSTSVTVARQPTTLHPWLSKQWTSAFVVAQVVQHRSHLLKVLFSMYQLAGSLVWRVAREHALALNNPRGGGVNMILSNTYRASFNFLLTMLQQDAWEKISLAAARGLTLACSSYECGIVWDQHYCTDQVHFLACSDSDTATMAHFLKRFEIPLQIRCLESALLLLIAAPSEIAVSTTPGAGVTPVYTYWKLCSPLGSVSSSSDSSSNQQRHTVHQPRKELTLLLLLHSNLRLLRVILSSAKERWLLASSTVACDEGATGVSCAGGVGTSRYEEELSMDIVTSEYERVTAILFHALPDLIRKLNAVFATEYRHQGISSGDAAGTVDGDPCVIFLDDYFQHMALLDIHLGPVQPGGRFYGEGSQVTSRRRVVADVLEMVLEFFMLTGQTDLLSSTNINITRDSYDGESSSMSMSIHSAIVKLLENFRGCYGPPRGMCCSCSSSGLSAGGDWISSGAQDSPLSKSRSRPEGGTEGGSSPLRAGFMENEDSEDDDEI